MSLIQKAKKLISSYKVKRNKLKVRVMGIPVEIPFEKILTNHLSIPSKNYGKIWITYYNQNVSIGSEKPEIYNKSGQKMDIFFLRDMHTAHAPYEDVMVSKYFLWDRFDFGLKTHFYTHDAMLETMGTPDHKYGMLIESPAIVPND